MKTLLEDNIEIRQICYFLTVVECNNSFSQAAERLQIDQPPLSQRIKSLERRLNVTLFDRRRRPVHLTAAGRVFWEESQKAIAQLEKAIAQAGRAEKGDIGHLTVGLASSAANGIFSDLLRKFRMSHSQVTVALKELTAEQQIQALEARQLDIGFEVISPSQLENRGLRWQVVTEESLVVVLPEGHSLTAKKTVALTALAAEPLILPNVQAFPFYQAFMDECSAAGFEPQIIESTTATWMLSILGLVAAGVGLAILPSNVLNLQRKGVVYREISGLNLTRQIVAVWRKEHNSATLKQFLEMLADR